MRDSSFFDGVAQADIDSILGRSKLPVFYYDTHMMLGAFPARYTALCRAMPDPRFVPARLAPGLGMVAVSCVEHRDTDIGAYNELAVAVPLSYPGWRVNLPGRALLEGERYGQLHAFVLQLPVTSENARAGGVEFFNFPKIVVDIDFEEAGGRRVCRLAEGDTEILRFSGSLLPAAGGAQMQFFFHTWMDGQPQGAEFKIRHVARSRSLRPGAATLELGANHRVARQLDSLLVSRRSLRYDIDPHLEAILYGPERLGMSLLQKLTGSALARGGLSNRLGRQACMS